MNDITPPPAPAAGPEPEQPPQPQPTPVPTPPGQPGPAAAPNPPVPPAPVQPPVPTPSQPTPPQTSTLGVVAPSTPPPPQPTAPEQTSSSMLGSLASSFVSGLTFLFSWIIFPLAAVLILHYFVFQAYHVVGTSMVPTLHQTDYLIISKVDYTKALIERGVFHKNTDYIPKRNQIIVFHYPKQPDLIFVKRVIGLPGEHIVIQGGKVTIYNKAHPNGFDPNTGYEGRTQTTLGEVDEVVPADSVFVLGDNRTPGGSFDSRDWGDLPSSYIIGNAVLRLLPLDQVKTF